MSTRLLAIPGTVNVWPLNCVEEGHDLGGGHDLDRTCLINGPEAALPVPREALFSDCICRDSCALDIHNCDADAVCAPQTLSPKHHTPNPEPYT